MIHLGLELPALSTASILLAIGICSLISATNGLVACEIFPTGIRNIAFSVGIVLSSVGVALAPQLFVLV